MSETWTKLAERWLEYTIDLSNVDTPQAFEKALFEGLGITPDNVKQPWSPKAIHALWAAYLSTGYQERPHDGKIIRFIGWKQFANRMPRYARRLKSLLGSRSKNSPYALQLEFE